MEKIWHSVLIILSLLSSNHVVSMQNCGNCGRISVPYPLSTASNCGDQEYKVQCIAGSLWFNTLNSSASYLIKSINPLTRKLIIMPGNLVKDKCISTDFSTINIQLNSNLPFTITNSNTILLLNCTDSILRVKPPINCALNGICHEYIKTNALQCVNAPVCCIYKSSGSMTEIGGECGGYQSFVNLNPNVAPKKWPELGIELEWAIPKEPTCRSVVDCKELVNSKCLADNKIAGQKRCFCITGFQWDPITGMCDRDLNCKQKNVCKKKKQKKKTPVIAAAVVAVTGISVAVSIGAVFLYKRTQQLKREAKKIKKREELFNDKQSGKSTRVFTGKEITKATNNFSKENLIGTGGFGEVYKGILDDGTLTAIKRAKLGNTKGTDQVLNEVRILCQVNHRCLVRLLGCCVELDQPMMVYEFIPNGPLFDHLHSHRSGKWTPLSWLRRLQIAHQTAEGLAYLHSSAVPPIYHRDVKSSNILLDEKFNAKVSDFGLSRLVETSENNDTHIFTSAQGTLGYLDPEYYHNFQLTDKSDVYSFGVVLLELLTSKKAIDFNREEESVNLVVYMKKIMDEEKLMEVVDPFLKETGSQLEMETMKSFGYLAAGCLDQRKNRPSMKEVADEIEYIMSVVTGKSKEP
ncbi:hypothetical protein ACFE04_020181 [Oxalis oulophora]